MHSTSARTSDASLATAPSQPSIASVGEFRSAPRSIERSGLKLDELIPLYSLRIGRASFLLVVPA
jgi:hypothetical protein